MIIADPFHGAQNGNGRGDHAVPIQQTRRKEAKGDNAQPPPASGGGALPANQGGQGDDTAFPAVVRPKNEYHVFQTDDHDQRPEHQREDSHHIGMAYGNAVFAVKTLPNGVYRAGGDIPKNNAQGGQ